MGVDNVCLIFAAMMCEERLLFLSSSIYALTATTQALLQLFFPLQWWYAYIPSLAVHMLDAHQIPQP
jgi:hypothetical protein